MELAIEVVGKGKAKAKLDRRNPITAERIYKNLPFQGKANLWLEEVYFIIPLELEYENQSPTSDRGDISYWPPGAAFCVFYGKSQPASPVNHVGKVIGNLELFGEIEEGDRIIISRID